MGRTYKARMNEFLAELPEAEKAFRVFLAALPVKARRAQCNPFYRAWDSRQINCVHCGEPGVSWDHIPALSICHEYHVSKWFLFATCKKCNTKKRAESALVDLFCKVEAWIPWEDDTEIEQAD